MAMTIRTRRPDRICKDAFLAANLRYYNRERRIEKAKEPNVLLSAFSMAFFWEAHHHMGWEIPLSCALGEELAFVPSSWSCYV